MQCSCGGLPTRPFCGGLLDFEECKAPSTDRIFEIFGPLQRHLLCRKGRLMQRFDPELTALQRRLLSLLGLSPKVFMNT